MTLTAEQHAARATGLGGSDAAAALGISPWKTPYELYREKADGLPSAPIDPDAAEWGHLLEPAVATKWSRVTGKRVVVDERFHRSELFPFMGGHVDRMVPQDNAILECKTSGFLDRDAWGDEGSDEVPQHYLVQVVHYMIVTGAQLGHVAALFNGRTFRRYEIRRDHELEEMVIEGERVFWQRVVDRNPPPITTLGDVKLAWPRSTEREVEAPAEITDAYYRLLAIRKTLANIEPEQVAAELALKTFMADAGVLTIRGMPAITWKTSKPADVLDAKRVREFFPDAYEQCITERAGSRRFLLKG